MNSYSIYQVGLIKVLCERLIWSEEFDSLNFSTWTSTVSTYPQVIMIMMMAMMLRTIMERFPSPLWVGKPDQTMQYSGI